MDEMKETDNQLVSLTEGIEKNLVKALWKLSAGLLNIPLQKIDRHLAEKKADSDARIAFTKSLTQRISEQFEVPEEYATLAAAKAFGNIVQEQLNLDSILKQTQQLLQDTPPDKYEANRTIEDISDDWLNRFRESACQKSSEEAQELFSKVLAGEIRKPGSISLKALTTLADMDQEVSRLFRTFCSLCLVLLVEPKTYYFTQSKCYFEIKDARIPFLKAGINDISIMVEQQGELMSKFINISTAIYNSYGLNFNALSLLSEYNLIEATLDTSTYHEYDGFWYNNELWGILKPELTFQQSLEDLQEIPISGYGLTSIGRELFHIVDLITPHRYWHRISEYLKGFYNITLYKYPRPSKKTNPRYIYSSKHPRQ